MSVVNLACMADRLFEMYNSLIIEKTRATKCRETLKSRQLLLGPISFWYLGKKFDDKNLPTLAFVGKTTWMDPGDYSCIDKKETIYDGRPETIKFFGEGQKRCQYWRIIKEITSAIYPNRDENMEFLDRVFITNLVKCNVFEKGATSNNLTGFKVFANCIDIFEKEIEITKPSHVIFFTNDYYDQLIEKMDFGFGKNNFIDVYNDKKTITTRELKHKSVCWWHRRYPKTGKTQMQFLRTRHPQGAPRELKTEIISWIQETKNEQQLN
jgi:hypothetical protein